MSRNWNRWASRTGAILALAVFAACGDDGPTTPAALLAPTGLAGTSPSPTSIRVTWSASTGATGYRVERAPETGGTFAEVGATTTALEFVNSNLTPETGYRFRVLALRGTEVSPASSEVTVRTSNRAVVQVTADITANTTWTADNIYQLTRIISVANGATLTIQPGTRVIGGALTTGQAPPVTALLVLRGARISAVGTRDLPIVMTSSAAAGDRFPGDWGGLILVGNASSNRTGRTVVEGPAPADTVSWNGGANDADNSGSLVYTRVEFAGAASQLNVELNAFSFYAIGRGTRLEYLQAVRGLDDQFEFFGGTVDGRYLVSYESGDDHFDAAEGFRGRLQYLIALQTGPRVTPRAGNPGALSAEQSGFEVDGCGSASGTCAAGFNSTPYSMPVFANFTVIGPGTGVLPVRAGGDGGLGANLRRGVGGVWMNGVIGRWPEAAISVFDPETNTRITDDSLNLRNLLFAENARDYDAVGATNRFGTADKFANANIRTSAAAVNTLFTAVPAAATVIANGTALDWSPVAGSLLTTGGTGTTLPGRVPQRVTNFFGGTMAGTTFVGAADPAATDKWWTGWTVYYRN
jgi:Fibronectin type III domain